ncbi:mitochondrial 54S ribosomal protein uL10m [Phyllosticta citriasiana]|uniref:mitochondrial 54S ribosomal protein uL10m n=1 Tax=Phyllosticta citriasiana TaxID=595635 RepID=UPI0030FDB2DE
MPPRIPRLPHLRKVRVYNHQIRLEQQSIRGLASAATATVSPAPIDQTVGAVTPIQRYPKTQPPSYKPAEVRKTQLLRQYVSLLRSSPLILLFHHNNLRAVEWAGIRRELAKALRSVDAELAPGVSADQAIHLHTVQTGMLEPALRIVEFYDPKLAKMRQEAANATAGAQDQFAHKIAGKRRKKVSLKPLLSGPVALVTFPAVSPQHLAAVLSILAPSPQFPAPRRKVNPDYHEPAVQVGLSKLMLLGARVEGKVFDFEGTRWVGGIEGGLDGLRGQLVNMLQAAPVGVVGALEGASKSLWWALESRRADMDEKENPKRTDEGAEKE